MSLNLQPPPPPPPCPSCKAKPGEDHAAGCSYLAAVRADAYPEILDQNGRRWELNALDASAAEITRLRAEIVEWKGAATIGDGSPMMTPGKLEKALETLLDMQSAQVAEIARLTQDADTIRAAERERCARIAEATMEAAAEAFDLSARAEGFMGISSRALARPHVAAAVTAIAAAIRGENP